MLRSLIYQSVSFWAFAVYRAQAEDMWVDRNCAWTRWGLLTETFTFGDEAYARMNPAVNDQNPIAPFQYALGTSSPSEQLTLREDSRPE